jgi:hypothetical protein
MGRPVVVGDTMTTEYVDRKTADYCREQGNPYAVPPVIKVIQWILEALRLKERAAEETAGETVKR